MDEAKIPPELLQILESNHFLGIEDYSERTAYSKYISYKVLQALYDVCNENADIELPWDDCVLAMRTTEKLREAAEAVIAYSIKDFIKNEYFNFQNPTPSPIDENWPGMQDGVLYGVRLFPDETGVIYIDFLFFNTEVVYFFYQLNSGKVYTWADYLAELQSDDQMWDTLVLAFRDALCRLCFRDGWLSEELEEVQFLHHPPNEM